MPPKSRLNVGKNNPQSKIQIQQKEKSKGNSPADAPTIAWPPIPAGLRLFEDLSLQHVVPGQIVLIPNFWMSNLCRTYVSFLRSLPLVTTPGKPKRGDAVRVNDRFQIDDPSFADALWNAGLKQLVLDAEQAAAGVDTTVPKEDALRELWGGDVLGLSPNIRIYRYSKGQYFDKHYDESNNILLPTPTSPTTAARTTWTLLLYLTSSAEGCIGGETVFYPDVAGAGKGGKKKGEGQESVGPVVVGLQTGMALLHRHGAKCMLHEGREVVEGEKWVIRSDLCVRR